MKLLIILLIIVIIIRLCRSSYEHMVDLGSEAVQNIASVYNANNLTASKITSTGEISGVDINGKSIKTSGDATINGNLTVKGNITIDVGKKIKMGNAEIYMGADNAIYINPGGNNALIVKNDGNFWKVTQNGWKDVLTGIHYDTLTDKINKINDVMIRKDKKYAIQSPLGGYLSDKGGWGPKPQAADWREVMKFEELSF